MVDLLGVRHGRSAFDTAGRVRLAREPATDVPLDGLQLRALFWRGEA